MQTPTCNPSFSSLARWAIAIPLALCSALFQSHGQGTLHITFNGFPSQPWGTSFSVQQYFESGMWFRPLGVVGPGNTFSRRRGGDPTPPAPDNGTAYLAAALGDSLAFSFTDGTIFSMMSVDLAEYSTVVSGAATVPFIGYRLDGSTVAVNLTTDGIIDGSGPLADFQTFQFSPEWSGLARVEIPTYGWSLDNLVVSIPEPGTWTVMMLGAAFLGFRFFKKAN